MVTKRRARRRLWWLLGTVAVLVAAVGLGIVGSGDPVGDRLDRGWQPAVAAEVGDEIVVATEASAPALANRTARRLLASAPVAVVTPAGATAGVAEAVAAAEDLRSPLLFAPASSTADEALDLATAIEDLGTRFLVPIGAPDLPAAVTEAVQIVRPSGDRYASFVDSASETSAADAARGGGAVVLVRPDDPAVELAGPAIRAAGHDVVRLQADDPRADRRAAQRLRRLDRPVTALVGSTGAWSDVDTDALRWQAGVARAGDQLPGGGQLMFPFRILVALYGVPGSGALGVLGEQDVEASIARAEALAAAHQRFSDVPVVPAFELIATVATGGPGERGDYSRRVARGLIEEWVEAAGEAGVYVVLDLQPGRTSFLAQARELRDVLAQPHVGLALDAEWRLRPDEEHLDQIGSVSVEEVNAVGHWLADLTRNERLPQKLLLLHQFNLDMIRGRSRLDTTRTEITIAIQMDGQGTQEAKLETWNQLRTVDPPTGVWWGWKNFYDEDPVVRNPRDTLGLSPVPVFVSYQ